jgi:hypothetical protein
VPSWRHLNGGLRLAILMSLIGVALLSVWSVLMNRPLGEQAPELAAFGCAFLITISVAIYQLAIRLVLVVTKDTFALARVGPSNHLRWTTWPRSAILEVKLNSHSRKVNLRITGQHTLELFVGGREDVARSIADVLAGALRGSYQPFPSGVDWLRQDARRGRRLLLPLFYGAFIGVEAAGLLLILFARDWAPAGVLTIMGGLMAAAIGGGLLFGTQDKEFYL